MALDPFEDDPVAEAELVPAEWKRQSRAARRSLQRMARRQERQGIDPGLENLGDLGAAWQQPARDAGGQVGGNETVQAIRELNETARAIQQLLEEIKNALPTVGAYGP
jgi:hypothetical protein